MLSSFQFEGLVSSLGGLLGLWIGLSMLSICELFDVFLDLYSLWLLREKREKYKHLENVVIPGSQPVTQPDLNSGQQTRPTTVASNIIRAPPRGRGRRGRRRRGGRAAIAMMKARMARNSVSDASLLYPPVVAAGQIASRPATSGNKDERDLALLLAA